MKGRSGYLLGLALLLSAGPLLAVKIDRDPLQYLPANVGPLFLPGGESVRLVVKDERPADAVVSVGFMQQTMMPTTLFLSVSDRPDAVTSFFDSAAQEATKILGLAAGDGAVLELTIKEFQITASALRSSWTGLNYIGYGQIESALKSPDGALMRGEKFRSAVFVSGWSLSIRSAIHYIYARAAWEVAARTLLAHFPLRSDPAAIGKLLKTLDTKDDNYRRADAVFWLGLVGRENPAVAEKLFALFRTEDDQTVRESAAMALATLAIPGAREEIQAVLAGAKNTEWDMTNVEEAWHLLHGLAVLGERNLGPKVPATTKEKERLMALVRFDETGEIPALAPEERKALDEGRKKLAK